MGRCIRSRYSREGLFTDLSSPSLVRRGTRTSVCARAATGTLAHARFTTSPGLHQPALSLEDKRCTGPHLTRVLRGSERPSTTHPASCGSHARIQGLRVLGSSQQALSGFESLKPQPTRPDIEWRPATAPATIQVFGIAHDPAFTGGANRDVAEHVLRWRPAAVVVETGVDPAHASATGNTVEYSEGLLQAPSGGMASQLLRLAWQLRREGFPDATAPPGGPLPSCPLWESLCAQLPTEQLVYVAAVTVGAPLVYGDRPKAAVYARLLQCQLADLDRAFGDYTAAQYAAWFRHLAPAQADEEGPGGAGAPTGAAAGGVGDSEGEAGSRAERPPTSIFASDTVVDRILFEERDEVLARSLLAASASSAASPHPEAPSAAHPCRPIVVGVVGRDHLEGISRSLASINSASFEASQDAGAAAAAAAAAAMAADPEAAGVQRAVLEAVLATRVSPVIMFDCRRTLGPLPPGAAHDAYELAFELYSTYRMQLAVLPRDLLNKVACGHKCDMWEVLRPIRDVRPANGGSGCNLRLVQELRTLNFEVA